MAVCIGCGLTTNENGVLVVDLVDGGGLECVDAVGGAGGLRVVPGATSISTSSSDTITFTGTGASGNPLQAHARIAGEPNGLEPTPNGLFAHCPDSIVGIMNPGGVFGGSFPINGIGPGTYNIFSVCANTATSDCVAGPGGTNHLRITNTLGCSIEGLLDVQAFGGRLTNCSAGFDAEASLLVNINMNPTYVQTNPQQVYKMNSGAGSYVVTNMTEKNWVSPMATNNYVTYSACISLAIISGTCDWQESPNFEYHWQFNQTGCC